MTEHVTISLDSQELAAARDRATALGLSLEQYLARLVRTDAGSARSGSQPISALFGLIPASAGPATDIARDKDKLVGEAVQMEHAGDMGER